MSQHATRLEAQYAAFSTRPDYGTAHESVQLFDMDARKLITPESVGLSVNLDHINDFMVANGANPEHLKYATIGFFDPESPHATTSHGVKRYGFVDSNMYLHQDSIGLRFPIIALEHDPDEPNASQLNFSLRHEIRHLLDPDSKPSYNNERLAGRLKSISAGVAALAVPTAIDMCNISTIRATLRTGISSSEYIGGLMATTVSALAATALTYGLAFKPQDVMHAFSLGEYKANHFSRKTRDFQPFSHLT